MTFAELCRLEPELERLHRLASMMKDDGTGAYFCANEIWYSLFKPKLYDLVGWGRKDALEREKQEAEDFKKDFPGVLIALPEGPPPVGIEIFDTCEAYDCAYQTIYDQLPNCRNCACL